MNYICKGKNLQKKGDVVENSKNEAKVGITGDNTDKYKKIKKFLQKIWQKK